VGAALLAGMAAASETKTYTYDALGRLTGSTIVGGPNNSRQIGTCFDRAGNRMRYDVATSAPSACPTPTPTPT
jgi:YD repeat-containing protein